MGNSFRNPQTNGNLVHVLLLKFGNKKSPTNQQQKVAVCRTRKRSNRKDWLIEQSQLALWRVLCLLYKRDYDCANSVGV